MAASSACLIGNGLTGKNTKPILEKEPYSRRLLHSYTLPPLQRASKPVSVMASQNQRQQHEGRRGFLKLLPGNAGLSVPTLLGGGKAYAADDQGVSSSRMFYSRVLEYSDKDRVKKVDLFENGTIAIMEAVSPKLGILGFPKSSFRNSERRTSTLLLIMLKRSRGLFCST